MSITKLKAAREKVTADGIGVYLPVMKTILAAIDEHIAEDNNTSGTPDATLTARAAAAEAQVASLQTQVAALKAAQAVIAPSVEKTADQKAVEASNLIQEAALAAAAEARNEQAKAEKK
jgi:hypothetical protein